MNNQEVFTKVVTHLRKQGVKSVNTIGDCLYRAPNGNSCAVGCLIPDKEYHCNFEQRTVSELVKSGDFPFLDGINPNLLTRLQNVHDLYLESSWEDLLSTLATKFDLTLPPLKG
jgi:hypothetical protein